MLNLQEITINFMTQRFQPELLDVVLQSCRVLHQFTLSDYEDDLVELLTSSEEMDSFDVRDRFTLRLTQEVYKLLEDHLIKVDKQAEPTLKELNEFGLFLLRLQNLENTDQVSYRVHGAGTAKAIFVDLMNVYASLPRHRVMELIDSVDDALISSIRKLVDDQQTDSDSNELQRKTWTSFSSFTNTTECLGSRLYKEGYFGLTVSELSELSRFSLQTYLSDVAKQKPAQAALDTWSLLLICRDTYEDPMVSFDKVSSSLFTDPELVTAVRTIARMLYSDFNAWREAHKTAASNAKDTVS